MRIIRRLLVVYLLFVSISCSGKDKKGHDGDKKGDDSAKKGDADAKELGFGVRADDERVLPNDLKQIGLAYINYADSNNGRAPQKAEDLAPYFENSKKLLDHLKSKRIEFFYGVRLVEMTAGSSNTVLAHEKDVPTKGGWALYGDASVKKLTPEEFKKATLAKKKQ